MIILEPLEEDLTVCKVEDYSQVDPDRPFCFIGCTDRERSLVCRTSDVPSNTIAREDGWRAFRVAGSMEFSLVGILSGISGVLAEAGVSIFAVSTFDTDYVLTKRDSFEKALRSLEGAGYTVRGKG